ncbi:MAG TPA: hypothetical protein VEW71_03840 [Allosphingosinicella sp.]|nr:hypothetical protein [Allosphingosinicella sp.]
MDLGARRPYVAPAMEFLLILSAILSAVTGAFSGVSGPEARTHQAEVSLSAERAAPAAREAATGIDLAVPQVGPLLAEVDASPVFALAAMVPLYADRLIE